MPNAIGSKKSVRLHSGFSRINEHLTDLFDSSGVRRSFTLPYVHDQDTADHIQAIGVAAKANGEPLAKTFITTAHHSGGRGYGSGDGATVGHATDALRKTLVTKNNSHALDAISATRSFLNDIKSLLPDDPSTKQSLEQLKLVTKTGGEGMTLFDLGTFLIQ